MSSWICEHGATYEETKLQKQSMVSPKTRRLTAKLQMDKGWDGRASPTGLWRCHTCMWHRQKSTVRLKCFLMGEDETVRQGGHGAS